MNGSLNKMISGWGRYPTAKAVLIRPEQMNHVRPPQEGSLICRGQGRSYGDAALSSQGQVMLTERLNRFLAFDPTTGILTAEAGVTLAEILEVFVPRGWFPAVTPGTRFVSLGGAVAADVHGKNHHLDGSFAVQVTEMELILADGRRQRCSPTQEAALFWATVGGMGLTGIITEVSCRLIPIETAAMVARNSQAVDLDAVFKGLEEADRDNPYTVAWIDGTRRGRQLGRGVVMGGRHARRDELPPDWKDPLRPPPRRTLTIPFDLPAWVLNRFTIAAYNHYYYRRQGNKGGPFIIDYPAFFYPLDGMAHWNRLYGKRGFLQYQVVLPEAQGQTGIRRLLEHLTKKRQAAFLAVLKRFGPGNSGHLSFPLAGYTLALDFPMRGPKVLELLRQLDTQVMEMGGRVYLAKDARLAPEYLPAMYPRLQEWRQVKQTVDPKGRFQSDLSRRLQLTGAV
jgi:decaprenylphospho-beta-D-ribofuranose 2-oxidase